MLYQTLIRPLLFRKDPEASHELILALMAQAEKFESDMKAAQTELEKKHAFEDARRAG